MKVLVLLFVVCFSSGAFAGKFVKPTYYECHGKRDRTLKFVYVVADLFGWPAGSFQQAVDSSGKLLKVSLFKEDLEVKKSQIGQWVTFQTEHQPHVFHKYATILLPNVNLDPKLLKAEFSALLLKTVKETTKGGTDLVKGSVESYLAYEIECFADFRNF